MRTSTADKNVLFFFTYSPNRLVCFSNGIIGGNCITGGPGAVMDTKGSRLVIFIQTNIVFAISGSFIHGRGRIIFQIC